MATCKGGFYISPWNMVANCMRDDCPYCSKGVSGKEAVKQLKQVMKATEGRVIVNV